MRRQNAIKSASQEPGGRERPPLPQVPTLKNLWRLLRRQTGMQRLGLGGPLAGS
jgi:hypothetical protein